MNQNFTCRFLGRLLAAGAMTLAGVGFASAEKTELVVPADMAGWTVVNANNDDYVWAYNADKEMAVVPQNKSLPADDWLISPAVTLKGGITYRIRVWVQNLSTFSSDKAAFEITVGKSQNVSDQEVIYLNDSFYKTTWLVERPDGKSESLYTPELDGEYYLGLHCNSKAYMGDVALQKFTYEEVLALPGAVTGLKATAAPEGEMKVDLEWTWPEKTSEGGVLSEEILGAKIYRSTSGSLSATDTYLIGEATGGAQGATGSYVDLPVEPGEYYYMVVPFTANGQSDATGAKAWTDWVGEDSGVKALESVTSTVVDDTTVEVMFDAPLGTNGGWINPENITYNISRKSGSGETVTLETDYAGSLPYVDATIPGLDSYTYSVYAKYNGTGSSWNAKTSNQVTCGGALSLPYSNDFSSSTKLDLFTVFHGDEGERDWYVSKGQAYFWGGKVADAWMITPMITLEAGKSYAISFKGKLEVAKESDYKTLAVTIGTEPTAEGQSTVLSDETYTSALYAEKVINFSVKADGNYCIGFHCHGLSSYNGIYLDDLLIEETVMRPASVEAVRVAAGEKGSLSATVSFEAPAISTAGTAIEMLSKVEVKRDGEVIETRENVPAGETVTVEDTAVETAGMHTYSVVTYLGEEASDEASASAWIGADVPAAPASVKARKNGDSEVEIGFEPVTEGVNGGYIDLDNLTYTVTRMPDAVVIADGTTETSVVDAGVDEIALQRYTYEVVAVTDGVSSEPAVSDGLVLGGAIALPYAPDMTDEATYDLWSFVADEGDGSWGRTFNGLTCQYVSNAPYAFTPPFKAPTGDYMLKCTFKSYSGRYHEMVDIILSTQPVHVGESTPEENGVESQAAIPEVYQVLRTVKAESSYDNNFEVPFTVVNNGNYYIGFRNVSNLHTDEENMSWGNYACHLTDMDLSLVKLNTGVEEVSADEAGISYDSVADMVLVDREGEIAVYDISGCHVSGADTSRLAAGVYIAVADMADGSRLSLRFVKK